MLTSLVINVSCTQNLDKAIWFDFFPLPQLVASKISSLENQLEELKQISTELTSSASAGLSNISSDLSTLKEETQTANDNVKTLVKSLGENSQSHVTATHSLKAEAQSAMEKMVHEVSLFLLIYDNEWGGALYQEVVQNGYDYKHILIYE